MLLRYLKKIFYNSVAELRSITTPLLTVSDDEEVYVYFSMTENQMLSLLRQYGSVDKSLAGMPKVSLQLSDGVKKEKGIA